MAKHASSWATNLQKLAAYYQETGNSLVPRKGKYMMLAKWVAFQRNQRRYRLTPDQVDDLRRIDPDFFAHKKPGRARWEAVWNAQLAALRTYRASHGDTRVPLDYSGTESESGKPSLGTWVTNQRKRFKQGKLRPDRRAKLDALGFEWELHQSPPNRRDVISASGKHAVEWDTMFAKLKRYKEDHGDCLVPYNFPADQALAYWVSTQRRVEKNKTWYQEKSSMRQDRRELLESIGFVWEVRPHILGIETPTSPTHQKTNK